MSELRLDQLIDDLESISNLQNMDPLNPIVVRLSHPTNRTVTVVACAQKEPSLLILPLNVTWIDFDPLSANYRKALRRVSKDVDAVHGRDHTWEIIENYNDVFVTQYYDAEDTAQLTTQNPVPAASPSILGVGPYLGGCSSAEQPRCSCRRRPASVRCSSADWPHAR